MSSESSVSLKSAQNRSKNNEKSRYLRDRLESINPNDLEEIQASSSASNFKRVNSFNTSSKPVFFVPGTSTSQHQNHGGRLVGSENEEIEPYAWLSQTAPASPLNGRSRSSSRNRGEDQYMFYLDSGQEENRKSRGSGQFSSLLIGKEHTDIN